MVVKSTVGAKQSILEKRSPASLSQPKGTLFRVLDANLNRAREGLRVCEEVARMVLEDGTLTRRCQQLRYALNAAGRSLPASSLLNSRNSDQDVGRPARRGPVRPHQKILDLVQANMRRVQEALRVLEEFTRLEFPEASGAFSSLRFRAYTLEQAFHSKLPTVRHR